MNISKNNIIKDLDKKFHKGYKTFLIHNNRSRPFLVAIKDKIVKIFGLGKNINTGENGPSDLSNASILCSQSK